MLENVDCSLATNSKVGLGGPDPAVLARVEQELYNTLEIYNSILAKQKYIAGDEMTMADLFHLPTGAALRAGKWKAMFESFEHVERWFGELEKRNSWIGSSQECNIFG